MSKITVSAFVATTGPMDDAYGGVRLTREAILRIAEGMRQGEAPLRAHHDDRVRLNTRVLNVETKDTGDGEFGVWIELEVEEEEWGRHHFGGFSISTIETTIALPSPGHPSIHLHADAAHFSDDTIATAATILHENFEVYAGRLYQFAVEPPPTVSIELLWITLQAIPANLLGSALYDVFKTLLQRPKKASRPILTFRFKRDRGSVSAYIATDDPAVAKKALATLRDVVLAAGDNEPGFEWKPDADTWTSYAKRTIKEDPPATDSTH